MYKWIDGKLTIVKDPNAKLNYGIDLVDWLNNDDSLASVSGIAVGIVEESVTISGTEVLAVLSGGTVGEETSYTFRFTTASGLVDDRTIYFDMQER